MFWRVLRAEFLKLRRTTALKMAIIAPVAVVVLMLFIASQMPLTMLRRRGIDNDWIALARMNFVFWSLLMLPLYITVQSALVAGVDHADNQWKSLLARPVPRYAFYLAKLTVVLTSVFVSTVVLLSGIFASGLLLSHLQNTASFKSPIPAGTIIRQGLLMTALAFLSLCLQHWISLRWRSFAGSTGVGIVAMVLGYGMVAASQPNGGWPQYFPWSLPMLAMASWSIDMPKVLGMYTALAVLVTLAGCAEFSRREVT